MFASVYLGSPHMQVQLIKTLSGSELHCTALHCTALHSEVSRIRLKLPEPILAAPNRLSARYRHLAGNVPAHPVGNGGQSVQTDCPVEMDAGNLSPAGWCQDGGKGGGKPPPWG